MVSSALMCYRISGSLEHAERQVSALKREVVELLQYPSGSTHSDTRACIDIAVGGAVSQASCSHLLRVFRFTSAENGHASFTAKLVFCFFWEHLCVRHVFSQKV